MREQNFKSENRNGIKIVQAFWNSSSKKPIDIRKLIDIIWWIILNLFLLPFEITLALELLFQRSDLPWICFKRVMFTFLISLRANDSLAFSSAVSF